MNKSFIDSMAGQDMQSRAIITKRLVQKWSKTGLLKKLNEKKSQVMANMLEEEAKALKQLNESSSVSDIAGFNKIAFPLVRRVFAQLIANEIVSVQPMSLPSGLLFYLDFQFDRNKSGYYQGGSIYGARNNPWNSPSQGVGDMVATGGFYELNSGYSTRSYAFSTSASFAAAGVVAITGTPSVGKATVVNAYDLTFSNSAYADILQIQNFRLAKVGEVVLASNSFRGMTPIESLTADSLYGSYAPELTQFLPNGNLRFWSATPLTGGTLTGAGNAIVVYGPARADVQDNPKTTALNDFEAVTGIPQLNISISSVPVMAQTRKLKTQWTPELAQDLNAYHALDAEVELTTILSEAIALEIDREILGELLHFATVKAAWSRKAGRYVTLSADGVSITTNSFSNASNSTYQSFFGTQQDWYQTLGETVTTVSNEIHKRSLRHGANFIVTSPEACSVIESINGFKPSVLMDASETTFSMGMEKTGGLNNRYTVYKDPYFPETYMLLGYKGGSFLETGYVYAPYVPLLVTPTIFAPEDFTPRRGVMTRYAKQMVRAEMYGTIQIADLDFIGSPASY